MQPAEMKLVYWSDICIPVFIAALFIIAEKMEITDLPSTDEWINKNMACVYNIVLCNIFTH